MDKLESEHTQEQSESNDPLSFLNSLPEIPKVEAKSIEPEPVVEEEEVSVDCSVEEKNSTAVEQDPDSGEDTPKVSAPDTSLSFLNDLPEIAPIKPANTADTNTLPQAEIPEPSEPEPVIEEKEPEPAPVVEEEPPPSIETASDSNEEVTPTPNVPDTSLSFLNNLPEIAPEKAEVPPQVDEVQEPEDVPPTEPVVEEKEEIVESQITESDSMVEQEPVREHVQEEVESKPVETEPVQPTESMVEEIVTSSIEKVSDLVEEAEITTEQSDPVAPAVQDVLPETSSSEVAVESQSTVSLGKDTASKPKKKKKSTTAYKPKKKTHAQIQREEKNRLEQEKARAKKAAILKQQQDAREQAEKSAHEQAKVSPLKKAKALFGKGKK